MAHCFHRLGRVLPAIVLVCAAAGIVIAVFFFNRDDEELIRKTSSGKGSRTVQKLIRPDAPATDYAGSDTCVECHAEICKTYQSHPMANSLAAVNQASPLEDYQKKNRFKTTAAVEYRVERTPQGIFHHETLIDDKGRKVYDQAVPVHYAVGSGKRGRTYLTDRDGSFYESPITWYSGRHRWDLSPGYTVGAHQRFERRIFDGCIACHAGRINFNAQQAHRFLKPPFIELSIGCERCHGPAQKHVDLHHGKTGVHGPDPIVNPGKLEPRRRDAVCFGCHMHGVARILRYGRRSYDFRPGQTLGQTWTVFLNGTNVGIDGSTKAVSQSEQMLSSVCYTSRGQIMRFL